MDETKERLPEGMKNHWLIDSVKENFFSLIWLLTSFQLVAKSKHCSLTEVIQHMIQLFYGALKSPMLASKAIYCGQQRKGK